MPAGRLDFLVRAFALDLRSLALMRILVGLGFLVCRLINIPWIGEFQTDFGSYPRVCASLFPAGQSGLPYGFSLFNATGSEAGVMLLYGLTMAAGLALVLGYRTRMATFCCWLLGSSLYYRCPLINPASDAEVLLCLFFGFFLPWGERWSLDRPSRMADEPQAPQLVPPQAAVLGWRIQVSGLYITAAFSKTSFHWGNGTATYVALRSDAWSSPLGRWIAGILSHYPDESAHLTGFVVFLEFFLPFLLLTPVVRLQLVGLIGLVVMHAAFGLALHLEAFSPLAMACLAGFIPSMCWTRLGLIERHLDRLFSSSKHSTVASGDFRLSPFSAAFVSWAVLGMVWTCAMSVRIVAPAWTDRILTPWHSLGMQQSWGMFVPPPFQGGWYLFRGRTVRGDWVNLEVAGDQADSLAMPMELDQSMPTSRHVLLYQTLIMKDAKLEPLQQRIADDFRVRWEKKHPGVTDRLIEIEIYRFYREYDCYKDAVSTPQLTFVLKKSVP